MLQWTLSRVFVLPGKYEEGRGNLYARKWWCVWLWSWNWVRKERIAVGCGPLKKCYIHWIGTSWWLSIQEIPEGERKIKGRLLANGAEIIDVLCLSPLECKVCEDTDLAILLTFVPQGLTCSKYLNICQINWVIHEWRHIKYAGMTLNVLRSKAS